MKNYIDKIKNTFIKTKDYLIAKIKALQTKDYIIISAYLILSIASFILLKNFRLIILFTIIILVYYIGGYFMKKATDFRRHLNVVNQVSYMTKKVMKYTL